MLSSASLSILFRISRILDETENKALMSLTFMGDGIPDAVVGFSSMALKPAVVAACSLLVSCQSACLADRLSWGTTVFGA